MAGLKDIRNRIASVRSTRQITSAMKMVAAAKLKRAQNMVTQIRPYSEKLTEVLQEVSSGLDKNHKNIFINDNESKTVLIVLMASNRGLCGAFNTNICKKAISHVEENYAEQAKEGKVKFYCIGKKAIDYIRKSNYEIYKTEIGIYDDLTYSNANKISESLMEIFANEEFERIDLVYNSFKNAAVHEQIVERFLPMTLEVEEKTNPSEYIFEPEINKILDEMLPKALKIQFFKTILETNAAEQGARMTAMHQATDNATEMIKELTLMYNKARQAAITNELIEITSGAEALKG